MQKIIQAARQEHLLSAVLHDLADFRPISRVVTVIWTMLACRLGFHRAVTSFGEGVNQQFGAFRAQINGSARDFPHVVGLQIDRVALPIRMLVAAVQVDEQRQRAEVVFKVFRRIGHVYPQAYFVPEIFWNAV